MTGLHLEGTASIDGTTVFDGVALPVVAGHWTCLLAVSYTHLTLPTKA